MLARLIFRSTIQACFSFNKGFETRKPMFTLVGLGPFSTIKKKEGIKGNYIKRGSLIGLNVFQICCHVAHNSEQLHLYI